MRPRTRSVLRSVSRTRCRRSLQHLAPGLIDAAKSSFVDGFHVAALIAAVLVFGAALGVLRFLPARGTDEEPAAHAVAGDERSEAPTGRRTGAARRALNGLAKHGDA